MEIGACLSTGSTDLDAMLEMLGVEWCAIRIIGYLWLLRWVWRTLRVARLFGEYLWWVWRCIWESVAWEIRRLFDAFLKRVRHQSPLSASPRWLALCRGMIGVQVEINFLNGKWMLTPVLVKTEYVCHCMLLLVTRGSLHWKLYEFQTPLNVPAFVGLRFRYQLFPVEDQLWCRMFENKYPELWATKVRCNVRSVLLKYCLVWISRQNTTLL